MKIKLVNPELSRNATLLLLYFTMVFTFNMVDLSSLVVGG